jgi:uncharacterized membrane protein YhaH (DUF805 family)
MDYKWFLLSLEGRINRKPFWLYALVVFAISFIVTLVLGGASNVNPNTLSLILTLIFLWPNIAVQAKRWHDLDKSAWWILINLIPILGPIAALIMTGFLRGTQGDNKYGPDPLASGQQIPLSDAPSEEITTDSADTPQE